jgi:hypothetical protein
MCNKICPDKILANNRIDKLNIRAKYEIISNGIKNQAKTNEIPLGTYILKKFQL